MGNLVLAILALLVAFPRYPQAFPFDDANRQQWQRAYASHRPGPLLDAELRRIDERVAELHTDLVDGRLTVERFTIEEGRLRIHRHLLRCLALVVAPRDVAPSLIVIRATREEATRVFPLGKLPIAGLEENHVYEIEPGSRRRVRYLALYRWAGGEPFLVFAREPEKITSQSREPEKITSQSRGER